MRFCRLGIAVGLLAAAQARAIEVPMQSCTAVSTFCGGAAPSYGGPTPTDWDAAAQLFCQRLAASRFDNMSIAACCAASCASVVQSCRLESVAAQPNFQGANNGGAYVTLDAYNPITMQTWKYPQVGSYLGAYWAPTCLCPTNAGFAGVNTGKCSCVPGAIWEGTQCIYPVNCTKSIYLQTCSSSILPMKNTGKGCTVPGPGGGPKGPTDCLVGDPFDPATGINTHHVTLFETPTLSLGLTYNSVPLGSPFPLQPLPFGAGWNFSLGTRVLTSFTGMVGVVRPRGQIYQFLTPTSGSTWVADPDVPDKLERITGGWKYTRASDDAVEQYDDLGELVSVTERNGEVVTLTWVALDPDAGVAPKPPLLTSITDGYGRHADFTYDIRGRVVSMTDPAGGVYAFAYDGVSEVIVGSNASANDLTSITFPGGKQQVFFYNEQANTSGANLANSLTGIVDENGSREVTFSYDPQGRAIASRLGGDAGFTLASYDGGITRVTDGLGATRAYSVLGVQGVGRIGAIDGGPCPSCGPAAQTFDSSGYLASQTDWNGVRTTYQRAVAGRPDLESSRTEAAGTSIARTVTTQWHATLRLPTLVTEPGRTTAWTYDSSGNVLSRTVTDTTRNVSRAWAYTWDSRGRMLTSDGPRTDLSDVTTYTYYPDNDSDASRRGRLSTVTNPRGHVTRFTAWDLMGNLLTVMDANNVQTTLVWDARGRLLSSTTGGETISFAYDFAGNIVQLSEPDGAMLAMSYDAVNRLIAIADNEGNRIVYTLDAAGNRLQEDVVDPSSTLRRTFSRTYNALNQLRTEVSGVGDTTTYVRDGNGNPTQVTDPLNRVSTRTYDALGNLISATEPGISASFGWDALMNSTSITDARGLVTSYQYDALGNLLTVTSPDTGASTNTYDAAGNLLTHLDAKGQLTVLSYDALNRPTQLGYSDGSTVALTYDQGTNGVGRLTAVTDASGATAYAYDAIGRLVSETTQHATSSATLSLTVAYTWTQGRLRGVTYPSGRSFAYTSDANRRIGKIETTAGATTVVADQIVYRPFGALASWRAVDGSTLARSFDLAGRITRFDAAGKTWSLSLDAASRITAITDVANASDARSFTYDALDRVTQATTPWGTETLTYDPNGNRLSRNAQVLSYSAGSNRLMSSSAPNATYVYDANGSVVDDGARQLTYDARGRLVRAVSGGKTATYVIDAAGHRVGKIVRHAP